MPSPQMIDFVIGLLQVLALAFLAFGAYLATRRAGVRPNLAEPPLRSADSEKKLVLDDPIEPLPERRSRTRRKTDRRSGSHEKIYGLAK